MPANTPQLLRRLYLQTLYKPRQILLLDLDNRRIEHVMFRPGAALLCCLLERKTKFAAVSTRNTHSYLLFPHVAELRRARYPYHEVRPFVLVQARHDKRQRPT